MPKGTQTFAAATLPGRHCCCGAQARPSLLVDKPCAVPIATLRDEHPGPLCARPGLLPLTPPAIPIPQRSPADDIQSTCDSLGFEKLKILSVEPGKDENEGYVTFQVGNCVCFIVGSSCGLCMGGGASPLHDVLTLPVMQLVQKRRPRCCPWRVAGHCRLLACFKDRAALRTQPVFCSLPSPHPPAHQTWFKTQGQMGQRAQGWHTQAFVERSRFLKNDSGRWLYVDGEQEWQR